MGQLVWNPDWDTGFDIIDEQHRQLLSQFNDFLSAVRQDFHGEHVRNLLEFLIDFLDAHCEEEEFQMRSTGYPRLVEHKAFHEHLRSTAKTLADLSNKDPDVFRAEVTAFVQDWIDHHITGEDRLLAEHLLKHSRKEPRPAP